VELKSILNSVGINLARHWVSFCVVVEKQE